MLCMPYMLYLMRFPRVQYNRYTYYICSHFKSVKCFICLICFIKCDPPGYKRYTCVLILNRLNALYALYVVFSAIPLGILTDIYTFVLILTVKLNQLRRAD